MPLDLKRMERDILEAAHNPGNIAVLTARATPASRALFKKYSSIEEGEQLLAVFQYLVEQRYLMPGIDWDTGSENKYFARGLTPKGAKRLRELQAPKWTWFKSNWFPTLVAGITAIAAVGSIVVDATCNRG